MTSRRKFLTSAACGTCLMLAGGSMLMLSGCAGPKVFMNTEASTFSIPLAAFDTEPFVVVDHKDRGKILIRKNGQDRFKALSLECTHKGGPVIPSKDGLKCKWHGSLFSDDGKVTKGPARSDLPEFTTSLKGGNVMVQVA